MAFEQKTLNNIPNNDTQLASIMHGYDPSVKRCHGCDEKCKFCAARIGAATYVPMIGKVILTDYINEFGEDMHINAYNTADAATRESRFVCMLCDNFARMR